MSKKSSYIFTNLGLGAFLGLIAAPAQAICPVCIVAVGAGLGLSEYLGIDDSIAGLWIGGLLVAISLWTIEYFNKKNWTWGNRDLRDITIFLLYYTFTIWPLWAKDLIGHPNHRLFGIDKLILGIILGSIFFALANFSYKRLKAKNNNRAYFPFQKVVMPVATLLILSFIFYFITR
ncbi:MAG: hypothetical protein NTX66_03225 [Candidatus Falkowbacteria bacterium]|nr:hypothetical protein [Candidatus Falkowbacteria bacterium]